MNNVQDYSVLYNNAVHPVICESWHCMLASTCIASLFHQQGVLVHTTSLTPSLFIEVSVPSWESAWSCICVSPVVTAL